MYIDHVDESTGVGARFCLNAEHADSADVANISNRLSCGTVGNKTTPVYFTNGVPQTCEQLKTEILTLQVNGSTLGAFDGSEAVTVNIETISEEDVNELLTGYLPLSAGQDKKLTGPLGLTENIMYGTTLPATGFDGQLFFLAEDSDEIPLYVPYGGSTGHVLIKNSSADGDYQWKELVALPKGGVKGQALIKNSATDGDGVWTNSNITWTSGTSAGPKPKIFGTDGDAIPSAGASASGIVTTGTQTFAGSKTFNSTTYHKDNIYLLESSLTKGTIPSEATYSSIVVLDSSNSTAAAHRQSMIQSYVNTDGVSSIRMYAYQWATDATANSYIYVQEAADGTGKAGSSAPFYGAVWNDYAEFRSQKESIEPGYCVASADNGQVYKTTEKFQACDGIVSDTFGFSIGETDECQTPLAVAGRVLAYCEGDRTDYHSGDTVCAGPDGKVCKMTREEIREWPDRIIGIVSEIPEYERWGDGNVPVNGRIWIKVK